MPLPDKALEPLNPGPHTREPSPSDDTEYPPGVYQGRRLDYAGIPDAQPFPAAGLSYATSRSASPPDTRRSSYFNRLQGDSYTSFASLTAGDTLLGGSTPRPGDRRSLGTLNTDFNQFPQDLHTRLLAEKRSGEVAQWVIHWTTPAMMGGFWLAGFVAAIAHHVFYLLLDGKPATNQLIMFRIGTAFAFFVRAMFVASGILSYRQRIWETFRNKPLTIGAIDALFSATEDLFGFTNSEMWKNAKVAVFMAIVTWLIPLASVLSPSALITGIKPFYQEAMCPSVPSLNFSQEGVYDFRYRDLFPGYSLSYYNTTDIDAKKPGWFDYYDQPSQNAKRLTTTSAYLRRPAVADLAGTRACGSGWNCTYIIEFNGPGYKCDEIASSSKPNQQQLTNMSSPFNTSSLAPVSSLIYMADVDAGEYADPQDLINNATLGVFKTEPVLWVGYSYLTGNPWPTGSNYSSDPLWSAGEIASKIMRCVHYEVAYEVQLNYTDGVQSANILKRNYLAPIVNTSIVLTGSTLSGVPESNWVRPSVDKYKYKLTTVYHVLGTMLRSFLRGSIEAKSTYVLTKSDISETRLTDSTSAYPLNNLDTQLQSVYEDMVISLLSEPKLIIAANVSVPCRKSKSMIVHIYRQQGLWIGYATATFVSFVLLAIGSLSVYRNGVSSDTLFSRIMVTTRNPTIDQLSVGACLGSDPFPKELTKTKLRFGVLASRDVDKPFDDVTLNDRIEHVGFGTIEEVTPLRKGGKYA